MDARLITEEPELVLAHLAARRASDEQKSSVSDIGGAFVVAVVRFGARSRSGGRTHERRGIE